jgi:large subunit ribosomal protein L21
MAKYAVVALGGRQYKVTEGEEILVDLTSDPKIESKTLLLVEEGKVTIGKPVVKGSLITFKRISEMEKGEKIEVLKYRAKSRYRRKMGFRPKVTRLKVEKIS